MALYLGKDKIAGFSTDSRIGDTLPVGAIIDYDGTEVPANWELVENSESGAGTVFISMFDAEEEVYDKMFSAVEPFDDEVNGLNARLIKHVIYEYSEYGDLRYHHAMNSYGEFDDNGNMIAVTMDFYFINGNQEFIQEIRAYTDDNGNKTYEHGEGWMQYIREPADYLTSTDATIALSANQGRVLNEKIEASKAIYGNWTPEFQYYGTFDATGISTFDWSTIGSTPNLTYAVQKGQYVIEDVISEDGSLPARKKVTLTFHIEADFTKPSFGSRGVSVAMFLTTPFAPATGTNQQVFVGGCAAVGSVYSSTPEKLRTWVASPDYFSFSEDGTTASTKGHIYFRQSNFIITTDEMTSGDLVLLGSIEYFID